jgi:hypothetical protein
VGLNEGNPAVLSNATNALRIRLPRPTQPTSTGTLVSESDEQQKENMSLDNDIPHKSRAKIKLRDGFTLLLLPTADLDDTSGMRNTESEVDAFTEEEDDEKHTRRTFCPPEYRQSIVDMLERHYCAHPAIPGYAAPNPTAIRQWAVKQVYRFCMKNKLPEVWAYLWGNWYRKGRWELWARSGHDQIPVLKTTMILESQ